MDASIKRTINELLDFLELNKEIKEVEIDDTKAKIHVKLVKHDRKNG